MSIDRLATMMRSNLCDLCCGSKDGLRRSLIHPNHNNQFSSYYFTVRRRACSMRIVDGSESVLLGVFGGEFDQALAPSAMTSRAHSEHSCFRVVNGGWMDGWMRRTQPMPRRLICMIRRICGTSTQMPHFPLSR